MWLWSQLGSVSRIIQANQYTVWQTVIIKYITIILYWSTSVVNCTVLGNGIYMHVCCMDRSETERERAAINYSYTISFPLSSFSLPLQSLLNPSYMHIYCILTLSIINYNTNDTQQRSKFWMNNRQPKLTLQRNLYSHSICLNTCHSLVTMILLVTTKGLISIFKAHWGPLMHAGTYYTSLIHN